MVSPDISLSPVWTNNHSTHWSIGNLIKEKKNRAAAFQFLAVEICWELTFSLKLAVVDLVMFGALHKWHLFHYVSSFLQLFLWRLEIRPPFLAVFVFFVHTSFILTVMNCNLKLSMKDKCVFKKKCHSSYDSKKLKYKKKMTSCQPKEFISVSSSKMSRLRFVFFPVTKEQSSKYIIISWRDEQKT